ncbi:hypothetical protein F5B20DRAFT_440938 [Whalleya microplaca]|nr:hypothetical protein F5B20DRAFT_440938 [Whalleya microplaca]
MASSTENTPNDVHNHARPPVVARTIKINKVQPSESSGSYFPEAGTSVSSVSSETPPVETPATTKALNSPIGHYPLPPLEREYVEPTEELDVARQLSLKPLPWSLHSSLQRAASSEQKPVVEDETERARKFAEAKRELLALADGLN